MFQDFRVAAPCSADWEKMIGDDRVRYCSDCKLNVYNFSAMTASEVQHLIVSHEGRLCGRFYRRQDGTVLTRDCPIGIRAVVRRISRVAGATLSAVMSLNLAVAQNSNQKAPSLVQIELRDATIIVRVLDPSGAVIPRAQVSLINGRTQEKLAGTSDAWGRLKMSSLMSGSYLLTVGYPGFRTVSQVVAVSGEETVEVRLPVDADLQMGVIVSPSEPVVLPEPIFNSLPDQIPPENPKLSPPISKPDHQKNILQKLLSPFHH